MPEKVEATNAEISGGQATSRRKFMGYIGLAGAGAALVACSPQNPPVVELTPAQQAAKQDLEILNYALVLEYLEAEFYNLFAVGGKYAANLKLDDVKKYAAEIAGHENSHVKVLTDTIVSLKGTPATKPTFDFSPLIGSKPINDELFLALAATFEPIGVRAYLGQVARLTNPALIAAAGAIHAVEADHVSAVQELRVKLGFNKQPNRQTDIAPQSVAKPTSLVAGDFDADYSPTPTAFWKALTMDQVLAIVKPVIK
ncbi:ferritin-like domain-containing protein [Deinococcus arenicola]|uniref:Ferritin-like domain-containing protein n=1 Tax=Deinococcus arenicola TaxID=2994950 RepID=A0ABU4DX11_9DEIO|nr:ferritin-like domain-containing protein [Deinococcus sp. ZS9-10]MDV6376589.1 ferritin-like domain-containing protein [Deinococcus sp. ZS9-10]